MRIGVEVAALSGRRTGVGHYLARLLQELLVREDGHEYVLLSHHPLDPADPGIRGAILADAHFRPSRWLWMQTVLPHALRSEGIQVSCFTNSLAPLRQHVPAVVVIHDASVFLVPQQHTLRRRVARSALVPMIARRARAVVTVSETARCDLVAALGVAPENVHVVYGAPPSGFGPVRDEPALAHVRDNHGLPARFVLFVGKLEPRKNLLRLVRAHQRARRNGLEDALVLAGPRGWRMRELDQAVATADGLYVLGYVPTEDLPALYSLASALAYPSLYEGFGLPLVEALACGAPVVAADRPWAREVCGDAALFVEPTDEDELAEALLALEGDERLRTQLRARGLERASHFSWETSAARMVHVLESAARS
jgi:glycosyltransferase involved in cell wall biosynthesis